MAICTICKNSKIRSRTNYPYGKKSKSRTTFTCKNCGSTRIEIPASNTNRRRRGR